MTLFGKLTQEEDQSTTLVKISKICFPKWLLIIQMKDQKSSRLLLIHGLKAKSALIVKLRMSFH